MLDGIERGAFHIVAAGDGHFGDLEAGGGGIVDHLGLDTHAVVAELEGGEGCVGEGAKAALGVVEVDFGGHVGGEGQDLLAEAAVAGDLNGVAFEESGAVDHVGFLPEDGLDEAGDLVGVVLAVGVQGHEDVHMIAYRPLKGGAKRHAFAGVGLMARTVAPISSATRKVLSALPSSMTSTSSTCCRALAITLPMAISSLNAGITATTVIF